MNQSLYSEDVNKQKFFHRYIKAFLDIIILGLLNKQSICGYELLTGVYGRFGILLSPGTLYPLLHKLEKKGLVEGKLDRKRKNYVLTRKGLETLKISSRYLKTLRSIFFNTLEEEQIFRMKKEIVI